MGDLLEQWRYGGSFINDVNHRREALNVMLSVPAGTRPECVRQAAREFAQVELAGHRWVMVLHEHRANPHVHLSVRAESVDGDRLNPRKAGLHRWRETFADKLRDLGIDAEATRGETRHHEALWRLKAKEDGRLRGDDQAAKSGDPHMTSHNGALEAWFHIAQALEGSDDASDRQLADQIRKFSMASPYLLEAARRRQQRAVPLERAPFEQAPQRGVDQRRQDPDIER